MLFRRGDKNRGLPEGWEDLLRRHVAVWRQLDDDERTILRYRMTHYLESWRWEAAQGFDLTDRIRVVIAAQAALLTLGFDDDRLADVRTVIVHPTTIRVHQTTAGPVGGTETCGSVDLLGETSYRGPVVIVWDAASHAARHPEHGHDVTLHEFAHKIDMLDQTVDGTPPLAPDDPLAHRWVDVSTRVFEHLVTNGDPVIDDYAATNAGEFFAVVTETFFTVPHRLAAEHPELYELYRDFYGQDPLERASRPARSD